MAQITLNSSGVASNGSLLLQSNGTTTAVTIDTAGNMGLGVTPSAWGLSGASTLQIRNAGFFGYLNRSYMSANMFLDSSGATKYIASDYSTYYVQLNGVHNWLTAPSGTAGNTISFTQAMTLDASGNLLVGDTATVGGAKFFVTGSVNSHIVRFYNTNASPYGPFVQYTTATPNNTSNEFYQANDQSALRFSVRSNGGIANYSANDVNLSDRREKTNFAPASNYLAKICAIPVQTFNYIDQNMEEDDGLTLGVVAQDVQAVAPELVMESNWASKDEEPKMRLSIYQTDLQYALMKSIQEQQAIITQLQADVAALKGTA